LPCQGIIGWKNTLKFYQKLVVEAEKLPWQASEVFSSNIVNSGSVKDSQLRRLQLNKDTSENKKASEGLGLNNKMPLSDSDAGGDELTRYEPRAVGCKSCDAAYDAPKISAW